MILLILILQQMHQSTLNIQHENLTKYEIAWSNMIFHVNVLRRMKLK